MGHHPFMPTIELKSFFTRIIWIVILPSLHPMLETHSRIDQTCLKLAKSQEKSARNDLPISTVSSQSSVGSHCDCRPICVVLCWQPSFRIGIGSCNFEPTGKQSDWLKNMRGFGPHEYANYSLFGDSHQFFLQLKLLFLTITQPAYLSCIHNKMSSSP